MQEYRQIFIQENIDISPIRIHRLIIDRLISPEFSCHEALRRVYRVTFRLVGIRPPTPPTPRRIPARDARQRAWTEAHDRPRARVEILRSPEKLSYAGRFIAYYKHAHARDTRSW